MAGVQGYRLFNVQLVRKTELSPSLLSLVFSGQEVSQMKCDSPDQRIKILFPSEDGTPPSLPAEGHWYQLVRGMPKEKRPVIRTYYAATCRSCLPGGHRGVYQSWYRRRGFGMGD